MKIKITRTSIVEYDAKDQDLVYYEEHDAVNNDQIALRDIKDLEEGTISIEDIDGGTVEHTFEAVLVDADLAEHEVNEANTERDKSLFPKDEDEEDAEEKPVAGELNAGGEAYGNYHNIPSIDYQSPYVPEAGNLQ